MPKGFRISLLKKRKKKALTNAPVIVKKNQDGRSETANCVCGLAK